MHSDAVMVCHSQARGCASGTLALELLCVFTVNLSLDMARLSESSLAGGGSDAIPWRNCALGVQLAPLAQWSAHRFMLPVIVLDACCRQQARVEGYSHVQGLLLAAFHGSPCLRRQSSTGPESP